MKKIEKENNMNYIVISDRWAQDEVEATVEEIQNQADVYSKERASQMDPEPPVTIEETTRNGCDVIIDDTGEVVAISVDDYDEWYK